MADNPRMDRIRTMLEVDPGDPFLRYALAIELIGESDYASAVAELARVNQESPGYVAAYFHHDRALVHLGRDAEARAVLRAGIAQATTVGESHAAEEMQGLLAQLGG
jgi:Flp pilus assembly protein TadD